MANQLFPIWKNSEIVFWTMSGLPSKTTIWKRFVNSYSQIFSCRILIIHVFNYSTGCCSQAVVISIISEISSYQVAQKYWQSLINHAHLINFFIVVVHYQAATFLRLISWAFFQSGYLIFWTEMGVNSVFYPAFSP